MTWNGIDLSGILGILATIVTGLLGWLATGIKQRQAAQTAQDKATTALLKLAAIASSLLSKGWTSLSPVLQQAFADGKFDDSDRAKVEEAVRLLLKDATDEDTLKEIGDALGLPLAGLIAKLAASMIEKWTQAHDPAITTTSKLTFPVATSGLSEEEAKSAYAGG